jgi:hypothetical protein
MRADKRMVENFYTYIGYRRCGWSPVRVWRILWIQSSMVALSGTHSGRSAWYQPNDFASALIGAGLGWVLCGAYMLSSWSDLSIARLCRFYKGVSRLKECFLKFNV